MIDFWMTRFWAVKASALTMASSAAAAAETAVETAAETAAGTVAETESMELLAEELAGQVDRWKGISLADFLDTYVPVVVDYILRIALALIIFAVGRKVIRSLVRLMDRTLERHGVEVTVRKFLRNVLTAVGYVCLVMILLQTVGVAATSLTAAFASAGVTIGLALQGSLSNLAGGILILLMKPFVIGDYIIQGSDEGTVTEIGLVYTKLLTGDNRVVMIPNGQLSDDSLTNVTSSTTRRLDITVGISYNADLQAAKAILERLVREDPARLEDQEMNVFVSALGDSAVILGLRFWVNNGDYWKAKWRLNEQIKLEFDAAGIEIPYNQLDVHLTNSPQKQ